MGDTDGDETEAQAVELPPYKVLGRLSDPADGVGVLGENTATTGVTAGVEGRVSSPDGYGVATPDDARVDGAIATTDGFRVAVDGDPVVRVGAQALTAGNVVLGHSANGVFDGAQAATIGGGGYNDGFTTNEHEIYDDYGTIGGGEANRVGRMDGDPGVDAHATVGGGVANRARAAAGTIAGGEDNRINPEDTGGAHGTVGGGRDNVVAEDGATVAGGEGNRVTASRATVGGGLGNAARATSATVGGGHRNEGVASNAVVGGGEGNRAHGGYSTVGGGDANTTGTSGGSDAYATTIGGGADNLVRTEGATVAGGTSNAATGYQGTVGGGDRNRATATRSTVSGGRKNHATAPGATVAGGGGNAAHGYDSTIGGGFDNRAGASGTSDGFAATVPGGEGNVATGTYALAAGRNAEADRAGSFVWSDATTGTTTSVYANSFVVDADAGMGVGAPGPLAQLHVRDAIHLSGTGIDTHVAGIENTATTDGADVLALKTNAASPTGITNYLTFLDDAGAVGAIEGTGGGVRLKSGGADYAEYLPHRDPDQSFEPGAVVGVEAGELVADAGDADHAMVVTEDAIVAGNAPPDESGWTPVAFTGQVPARVHGPVDAGDLIVPAGEGVGRAVAPATVDPQTPIVGRAWAGLETAAVGTVTVGVGVDGAVLAPALARHRDRLQALEAENDALRDRVAAIEAELGVEVVSADD